VTFWSTLVALANDSKIVHFTFYVYFPEILGLDVFGAMMGPPLDTPLCGAEGSGSGAGLKIE